MSGGIRLRGETESAEGVGCGCCGRVCGGGCGSGAEVCEGEVMDVGTIETLIFVRISSVKG